MAQIQKFRDDVLTSGALDPMGMHHEFASGAHGRKLDFDVIQKNDDLYDQWVALNIDALRKFGGNVVAVLGIANGTNPLSVDVAQELQIKSLTTQKTPSREVILTPQSAEWLNNQGRHNHGLVIALEDVGTTGGTALQALQHTIRARGDLHGTDEVGCLVTWQRTDTLGALDTAGINYQSIIHEILATYTPEQCQEQGYCSKGWNIIPWL